MAEITMCWQLEEREMHTIHRVENSRDTSSPNLVHKFGHNKVLIAFLFKLDKLTQKFISKKQQMHFCKNKEVIPALPIIKAEEVHHSND